VERVADGEGLPRSTSTYWAAGHRQAEDVELVQHVADDAPLPFTPGDFSAFTKCSGTFHVDLLVLDDALEVDMLHCS